MVMKGKIKASPKEMKWICLLVIDANILIQDFWIEGFSWNYLIKRGFLNHILVIPSIALEEAASHLVRRANDLLMRIAERGNTPKLLAQYQRLFNRKKIGKETASELGERYKRKIVNWTFADLHG